MLKKVIWTSASHFISCKNVLLYNVENTSSNKIICNYEQTLVFIVYLICFGAKDLSWILWCHFLRFGFYQETTCFSHHQFTYVDWRLSALLVYCWFFWLLYSLLHIRLYIVRNQNWIHTRYLQLCFGLKYRTWYVVNIT